MTDAPLINDLPPLSRAALFLDFDGTLVDIADRPDGILIPDDLLDLLSGLRDAVDGALAVVSGRATSDLRRFLPGLGPPMVGGHGAEWWLDDDPEMHAAAGGPEVAQMTAAAYALARQYPDLLIEEKPAGVVIHYRAAPDLQGTVERAAASFAAQHAGFETHAAKMAVELRPDDIGKDHAVSGLMKNAPFAGRIPVFIGDDATDEVAISWVERNSGMGIRVGEAETAARARLDDPTAVRALLRSLM